MTDRARTGTGGRTRQGPAYREVADVESFLSVIRYNESGEWEGNYNMRGRRINGDTPIGAYQILSEQWPSWAGRAGIPGADWRDPAAQDRVAAFRANELYQAFGSWDLVAMAWIGGSRSVRTVLQRGYDGPQSIRNPVIRQYVENYQMNARNIPTSVKPRTPIRQQYQPVSRGWVSPVAGPNEYSGGSWMPNTKTHRGRTHAAMDIYAKKGTPIVAPVSGKVLSAKRGDIGGFTARIKGDDGIIYYFAHMAQAAVVKAGQKIFAGGHIGFVGNSGSARNTSSHLHFSMKRASGEKINPKSFLDGSVGELGYNIAPMGDVYDQGNPALSKQLTGMLSQLSDSVAGGSRQAGIRIDPTVQDGTDQINTKPQSDLPDFLPGKDQYLNTEVP